MAYWVLPDDILFGDFHRLPGKKISDNGDQAESQIVEDCTDMPETESDQDRNAIPEGLTLKQSAGGQSGEICQLHWSPGGRFLASVTSDNSIEIWDAKNWQAYKVLNKVSLRNINMVW